MPMKFMITNDDGYEAPGLAALFQALSQIGDVVVVAPLQCHSSRGHAVETKNRIRVETRRHDVMGDITVVHSSPADCVRVGLAHVLEEPPDVVVAGINPGANLGVDLFYSGTAAAAREAAIMGTPAFALSRYFTDDRPVDWSALSAHVARVMKTMLADDYRLPQGHFWNVNFPAVQNDTYPDEIHLTHHGVLSHEISFRTVEEHSDGAQTLLFSGEYSSRGKSGECDVSHVFDEKITATPVGLLCSAFEKFAPATQVSLDDVNCVN